MSVTLCDRRHAFTTSLGPDVTGRGSIWRCDDCGGLGITVYPPPPTAPPAAPQGSQLPGGGGWIEEPIPGGPAVTLSYEQFRQLLRNHGALEAWDAATTRNPPEGSPLPGAAVPRGHCNRCERCGWKFGQPGSADCWPSNCSMRPMPPPRTHCAGCGAIFDDVVTTGNPPEGGALEGEMAEALRRLRDALVQPRADEDKLLWRCELCGWLWLRDGASPSGHASFPLSETHDKPCIVWAATKLLALYDASKAIPQSAPTGLVCGHPFADGSFCNQSADDDHGHPRIPQSGTVKEGTDGK